MSIDLVTKAAEANLQADAKAARAARNRRNAQKSTGPKTEAGKSRSRWNAVRHGASGTLLHRREDLLAANQLEKELRRDFQPQTVLEEQAIERMVFHAVQLRSLETQISTCQHLLVHDLREEAEQNGDPLPDDLEFASALGVLRHDHPERLAAVDRLYRYHRDHERDWRRSAELLTRLQRERRLAQKDAVETERNLARKQDDLHFANTAREQLKKVPSLQSLSPRGMMEWQKYEQERLAQTQTKPQNEATNPTENQPPEPQA